MVKRFNIIEICFLKSRFYRTYIILLVVLAACGTQTTRPTVQVLEGKKKNDKVLVPFTLGGGNAFSGKEAKKLLEARKKREEMTFLRKKRKFEDAAKLRYKGNENIYWVPPDTHDKLYTALSRFPKDSFGYPDWVRAVQIKYIMPLDSIKNDEDSDLPSEGTFNQDIIFKINDKMMANVKFPHSVHNYWLSCQICHPAIFIAKKGANDFGMNDIWSGKYCGRCHGKVAYMPKGFENCIRCHSVKRKKVSF